MKLRYLILGVVLSLGLVAGAQADRDGRRGDRRDRRAQEEQLVPPGFLRDRGSDRREFERDRIDRDQRGRGRLSEEERRQLRRDIRNAGREIYRDR